MRAAIFTIILASGQLVTAAVGNSITATPAALTFSYQIGNAALPVSQTLQVQSSPAGVNFTVAVTGAPFNAAWLLVSESTGKSPASLKVSVNPTGLAAGSYAGVITLAGTVGAAAVMQTAAVTLLVSTAAPTVTATPVALNFTYVTGSPIPAASLASAFVLSSSGAALSAQLSVTGAPWLKVTPTGNVSLIGLLNTISVTVDPTGLAPKAYSANITVSSPAAVNRTITIAVTLTVNAALPVVTGTWPAGVIQGAAQTIATVEGGSYYANSTVTVSGFTPDATVTVTDGVTTLNQTFEIPAYQAATAGLRVAVASPLPAGISGTAQLYANGLGPVTNTPASGDPARVSPLSQTTTTPVVNIGNQPAQVLFSGLAPGFAGLYQVNVVVPAGITAGNQPLTITIGSVTSPASGLQVK